MAASSSFASVSFHLHGTGSDVRISTGAGRPPLAHVEIGKSDNGLGLTTLTVCTGDPAALRAAAAAFAEAADRLVATLHHGPTEQAATR